MALRVFGLNLLKNNTNLALNIQRINNVSLTNKVFQQSPANYCTQITVQASPVALKKQKVSKAMQAYLERSQEHDEFMKNQQLDYQIGKRHLANMMGEDPETFTQEDVNNAVEYLFPSAIYDKKARPIMRRPEEIFPARKAAEFDESGRPFHSMFYTSTPNYYKLLYDIVEELNKLYDLEERMLRRGQQPDPNQKINMVGFSWITKEQMELVLVEKIHDVEFNSFITTMERLVNHPYSYKCKEFIDKYTKPLLDKSSQMEIPKPKIDDQGRQYITTYECLRKTARADVTVRVPGTGQISINGKDISYFEDIQPREQIKRKKRNLKDEWLNDPRIKIWAEKRDEKVYCKFCYNYLKFSAGKTDLIAHTTSKKHLDAANSILSNQMTIDSMYTSEKYGVKKAEVNLALFIVEYNIPFATADHLTKVCQHSFQDSNIASNITLGRTKAAAIVKNVVGNTQFRNVCDLLRNNTFSLCIDESTDLSNQKSLCLVVRVCINFEIKDLFFGLLSVEQCDSVSLYNLIVNHFKTNNIDYKRNMIGFAADGAPVMTGKTKSVAQLLKKDIPNLFIVKCVCHSLALCSSYACLKLPSAVETLARDVYNYLSNSPKRISQFNEIQKILEIKPLKILHPCQTRWLSLEIVVNRLLDLYEPLKIYFAFVANIDKIDSTQLILNNLNYKNKIYLSFLKYILGFINNINKMFQSETTEIQNLYIQMERLLKTIMSNFLKQELLKSEVSLIDYKNKFNFLDPTNVYLGIYAGSLIETSGLSTQEINEIINNCINFYEELCDQIFKRFEFGDKFKCLSGINPDVLINGQFNSILEILKQFPNLICEADMQTLDSEFRELKLIDLNNLDSKNNCLLSFWKNICEKQTIGSKLLFPKLCIFIQKVFVLPHSSANVERIFSHVNLNKTKQRNRLDKDSLEGILYTKDFLKLNKTNCYNTIIPSTILKQVNSQIYFK